MTTAGNFTITIQNDTGVEVKALKFQYRDGTKTQTENLFFGGSDRINAGKKKNIRVTCKE